MKEQDITKLEFLMTVNNNFIVQRFFNVKGYNPNAHRSVELMDLLDRFVEDLKYDFKMKTVSYMLDNQYQITEDPEILNTSFTDGPEVFNKKFNTRISRLRVSSLIFIQKTNIQWLTKILII